MTLSSSCQIHWLFPVFLTDALIIIKVYRLHTGLRVLLSEYCGIISRSSCARQLHLTALRLCLFCDHGNCGSTAVTAQENHNFPDFLTPGLFPDQCQIPWLFQVSTWMVTLYNSRLRWVLQDQTFVHTGRGLLTGRIPHTQNNSNKAWKNILSISAALYTTSLCYQRTWEWHKWLQGLVAHATACVPAILTSSPACRVRRTYCVSEFCGLCCSSDCPLVLNLETLPCETLTYSLFSAVDRHTPAAAGVRVYRSTTSM